MFAPHGNHIAPNADCTIFAYISKKIRRDETEQNKNRNIFIINNMPTIGIMRDTKKTL